MPLNASELSSCTSSYWDPAFQHLKFRKSDRAHDTRWEAQSWRTIF